VSAVNRYEPISLATRRARTAGRTAPDWSSGTRIASSLAEFNRRHGCDAVVSAHNLNALDALTHALADRIRRREAVPRPALRHGAHSIPTTKDACH
jgi:uncharacterized protein with von Willebrand factor type A (vWA) domain